MSALDVRTAAPPGGRIAARPVSEAVRVRWGWWRSGGRRNRLHTRPLLAPAPAGRLRLPGVRVETVLVEAADAYRRPAALVLLPLTAPMTGVDRKRVTLLYRPLDAAGAPTVLDRQVRAAINRAGRRRDLVHAHDSAEVLAALQAAQEEATGAGVVRFSLLVTVTVAGEDALRQAGETVTRAGRQAQIRLRPVHGAQAAAFATGLGVGVVPGHHSLVPPSLRETI